MPRHNDKVPYHSGKKLGHWCGSVFIKNSVIGSTIQMSERWMYNVLTTQCGACGLSKAHGRGILSSFYPVFTAIFNPE